ncbi:MAG: hypothetical protein WCJ63_09120, partial [Actinomycetes bacterium]
MKTRFVLLVSVLMVVSMLLTACPAPTPQVVIQTVQVEKIVEKPVEKIVEKIVEKPVEKIVEKQVTVAPAATAVPAKKIISWFQYDQGNVDPKSDEKVGNQYLRDTMPIFNKEFAGKLVWENQYTPWDRLSQKLIAAVQVKAEVPDLVEAGGSSVNTFYKNGAVQDLTEWAKAQKWYAEMDPSALKI